tara:strand:+ start:162 stop:776 length:615 start_codon:yes stop_codon:yes gene_type:complete
MNHSVVSPLILGNIRTSAKRLKRILPKKSHTELLDIASYLVTGADSYRDVRMAASKILNKRPITDKNQGPILLEMSEEGRSLTYGQQLEIEPTFKRGDWYFYPSERALVFEGEFSPYVLSVDKFKGPVELLDFVLQIQKKKWDKNQTKNTTVSPTYQVDEFIGLMDDLCRYYFDNSVQGVFCPHSTPKNVTWPSELVKHKKGSE